MSRPLANATAALRDILDGARGPVAPAIRAEIFGPERFAQHGRSLGATHGTRLAQRGSGSFFPRLSSNVEVLRKADRYIGQQAATGYDTSPAAQWLLDNFHLIDAQLHEVHKGLPRSYFRTLPVLLEPPLEGLPRVYGIAWAFVAHTDGAFDEDLLVQFLLAYQEARPLELREMWALPTTLRVVLIENLRRLAEREAYQEAAREAANLCSDAIATTSVAELEHWRARLEPLGVAPAFLAKLAQRFQDPHSGHDALQQAWLQQAEPDPAAFWRRQPAEQAADNLSVGNTMNALRAIGDADWGDIIERSSSLMRLLCGCESFNAEAIVTRDQSLHAIERLARRSRHSEITVATTLLGLMQAHTGEQAVASHWLAGPGKATLMVALGLDDKLAAVWRKMRRHAVLSAYFGVLGLGTVGLVAWLLPSAANEPGWLTLVGVLLMAFPASEAVIALVNRLISESVQPRLLPRLALKHGIGAEHRVMVVIPSMFSSLQGVADLAHRLQLHYLANPEPQAQFALLGDWPDADQQQMTTDAALLEAACAQLRTLNLRYPPLPGMAPRFLVLHRARRFSETEQRWIGWERKRGKLEQLVHALATGNRTPFLDLAELSQIASNTRYIVTLDSDTQLPPECLRRLVGVAAHPHNAPRIDPQTGRVVHGYGILQPQIATPLPKRGDFTLFHWLFAGQCGIDPYSAASSEVYQDLFGEGSFSGKGLLQVQAMHAVLSSRLPSEQVLSHDLLEGAIARCATVSDIALLEDAPFHADVAQSRIHRWIRGDWQLLPFVFTRSHWKLGTINRWKMFDNLRRSLVAPMSLALLALALGGLIISPWDAIALVLAAFAGGPLMGAIAGFAPSRDDIAKLHFYRLAAVGMGRVFGATAWQFAQLLQNASMSVDAVARALYRMVVSRRHLLQWTTAEAAQAQARTDLPALLRLHWRTPPMAALVLAAILASSDTFVWLACAICLSWAAQPLWTWLVSRPHTPAGDQELTSGEREHLHAIARATWGYFERCVGPDDNHLPPDNLQTTPHDMLAHRTSPTNIGLYLLSVACARNFGWIDTPQLLARLEATLATLLRLQRYRGHFLNWYDTQTCAPLPPLYVSTVDSGNLSGHLLAVAQACLALAASTSQTDAAGAPDARRLQAIAQALEQLAWAPEFGFLYHPRRHLLHIGYRVQEDMPDANFYDLLASECRLTSLLAIAKGDVPVRHWAALGRPFFASGALAGLRSWSGSMFEYMMPTLTLNEPYGSVMDGACRTALHEQIAYARRQGVPWGMSESAYAASDHTLAYQYAAQGVPALALRRTPVDDLVIAPYATALAAQFAPRAALANFDTLELLAPRTSCGYIDALDYTPSHQNASEAFTPVNTFMAHHQGMSLVALANVLLDGTAQRWGMSNARIEAVASLLHERAPREVPPLRHAPQRDLQTHRQRRRESSVPRLLTPGEAAVEPSHVLSNGHFSVVLRPNGSGWSRLGQTGISRWRDDALRDMYGNFIYLRRTDRDHPELAPALESVTRHPVPQRSARYACTFHPDRVCFDTRWPQLQALTTVWVSPEDDIEFRKVELHNLGERAVEIELLSAFEVTLADPRADESHPAFGNLFVASAWQPAQQALVFTRTPRLASEKGLQMAHFLADTQADVLELRLQTDRQRWLGRNHTPAQPQGQVDLPPQPGAAPSDRIGLNTALDPVSVLAVRVRIAPGAKAQLTFATAASLDPGTLHAIIDKYRQPSHVQRASLMSATLAGIRMRTMRMSARNLAAIQSLTTALVFGLARAPSHGDQTRAPTGTGTSDKRLLWRLGISGDKPVVLIWATVADGMSLLRVATQALRWWAWGGVGCDLIVVNLEPVSYLMELQRELTVLQERYAADTLGQAGAAHASLHILRGDALSADEQATLRRLARVQLHADGRPFSQLIDQWLTWHQEARTLRNTTNASPVATGAAPERGQTTARGQFDTASGEFRFDVSGEVRPKRPWINVLSNPQFGAQLSEGGGGYTWAVNSRLMQLTGWSNDPVADPPSEWFLLQDHRTRQAWSVAPGAWGAPGVRYQITHGQGFSTIGHRHRDLDVTASWCVDPVTSTKQVHLQITNGGDDTAQLRLFGIAEWIMGSQRGDRLSTHTASHASPDRLTLTCTQTEQSANFGNATAFLSLGLAPGDQAEWTCDRRELLDSQGTLQLPHPLGQSAGKGLDPCAALALRIAVKPGETSSHVFVLGFGADPAMALRGAARDGAVAADQRATAVRATWDTLLGAVQVTTPDPLFDVMVNRWLLYQNVACRMWAKAGFYQAGGATGYRDQLQDAMAMTWAAPRMLREQILIAASRQFAQGDVQHWWHAPDGAGVRTRFSDDLLWLPFACLHHLQTSGDSALLDQQVPFIEGPEIAAGAEDAYYVPTVSALQASVYEHAARAIDHSLRVGVHGLPLMGSGDWNDGMNRVGIEGRGESVWLAWFLCSVVSGFAPLARARGELARADGWERAARGWQDALQGAAWDGSWYRRAFFDDGQVLGSHTNTEGSIDLIAQAWGVLSGVAPPDRARQAMQAVDKHLLDAKAGLIRLLDPPLQHQSPSAGYIQAYPPGVRENGGQYSHAGVWALMAQAELGLREPRDAGAGDRVWRYFRWLNPAHRCADPAQRDAYGLEPYVMAGDVYSQPPYAGRGGWSWYTGSAGWMHRAAIESMFGLHLGPQTLYFTPCLPAHWSRVELVLKREGRSMRFILWRGRAAEALAAVAVPGAVLLHCGEMLAWNRLLEGACHVVPWGDTGVP
ncbi:MAG: carbohydrate-binding protein [Rhodoferax sp.]|nr:carbohydrate-binding protein [Rhodoferax sp.]